MQLRSLASYIAKLVWTTSDPMGAEFYNVTNVPWGRNIIMREYIYLKLGIAARLIYNASDTNNKHEADLVFNAVVDELEKGFANSSEYITYGGKPVEVRTRSLQYGKLVANNADLRQFESVFYDCLREHSDKIVSFPIMVMVVTTREGWLQDIEDYMSNKLIRYQNGGNSGCGCFSVVACISIFIVLLFAFMVF